MDDIKRIGSALQKALIIKYGVIILAMALVFWLVGMELKIREPWLRVACYFMSAFLLLYVGNRMDRVLKIPELSRRLAELQTVKKTREAR